MPELPEVETIRQDLQQLIKGKTFKSVTINLSKQVDNQNKSFKQKVVGSKVKSVERRSKALVIKLDNDYRMVFHLKMTGQVIYRGSQGELGGGGHPIQQDLEKLPNKYSHVVFKFGDGSQLFFNDQRQFGWVKVMDQKEWNQFSEKWGPEPLDNKFTITKFKQVLDGRRSTPIKVFLMKQDMIAGLGNIYAAEACFCAKIKPTRPVDKLKPAEIKKLYTCIRQVLRKAVQKKGTSARNYVDAMGRQGSMNDYLNVYGREGKKCKRCKKSTIKKIKQAQRSTEYCPQCQK